MSNAATAINRLRPITILAFFISSSASLLPYILHPAEFLRFDHIYTIMTTIVVVLTPPAVEPGQPPINMSIIVRSLLACVIAPKSTVLYPAVLGVTEAKNEVINLSLKGIPASTPFLSNTMNMIVGITTNIIELTTTIFVCRVYFLKCSLLCLMSAHTVNPRPPISISAIIVMLTT